jgi:hypothetical protein
MISLKTGIEGTVGVKMPKLPLQPQKKLFDKRRMISWNSSHFQKDVL